MEKLAIDFLWLRPGKVGGTESYIRNLLDGFLELDEEFEIGLLVSRDNSDSLRKYLCDRRFSFIEAPIQSNCISRRIIWQNIHQNKFLKKHGYRRCFVPVYCKPWLNGRVEYICVIHDLMMQYYPNNHPLYEVLYSKLCWKMDVLNAKKIIATTEFVKNDIESKYGRKDIEVINIPILINKDNIAPFDIIGCKYGIDQKGYFYTVAQLIPHKNLKTIVSMMDALVHKEKYRDNHLPRKLVITGVSGNAAKELNKQIEQLRLEENIVLTGFIDDTERNTLYKYAYMFLFPSVFEGFGMPPLEAMYMGCDVVTTKCASIPEVTQGMATYVDDPYDVDEWICKILHVNNKKCEVDFDRYDSKYLSSKYLKMLFEGEYENSD